MIVLLGATGYIGSAFAAELNRRKLKFEAPPRKWLDYSRRDVLTHYLRSIKPEFVINAAGYTGRPNVDACEEHRIETLLGNVMLPVNVACVCRSLNIRWGHVSSGCIYDGPGPYKETDLPNFDFHAERCSFYSGSKAMAEELLVDEQAYIWRLRIPFDEVDSPRNYLSKLLRYPKLINKENSLSHRGDFVKACLDLWQRGAAFGIYNMTNPGSASAAEITCCMNHAMNLGRRFNFFLDDDEFNRTVSAPRSNCVLDVSKLLAAGVKIRTVWDALSDAMTHWKAESPCQPGQ